MSESFSFIRFGKLLKLTIAEQKKILLIPFLIYTLLLGYLNYLLVSSENFSSTEAFQQAVVSGEGMLGSFFSALGILFTSTIICVLLLEIVNSVSMRQYQYRDTASVWMMLPCSMVEKFLAPFLIYVILLPILYLITTFGIEYIAVNSLMSNLNVLEELKTTVLETERDIPYFKIIGYYYLYIMSGVTIYFLGSTFFRGYAFLKTFLVVFCIGVFTGIFNVGITQVMEGLVDGGTANEVTDGMSSAEMVYIVINAAECIVFAVLSWFCFRRRSLP